MDNNKHIDNKSIITVLSAILLIASFLPWMQGESITISEFRIQGESITFFKLCFESIPHGEYHMFFLLGPALALFTILRMQLKWTYYRFAIASAIVYLLAVLDFPRINSNKDSAGVGLGFILILICSIALLVVTIKEMKSYRAVEEATARKATTGTVKREIATSVLWALSFIVSFVIAFGIGALLYLIGIRSFFLMLIICVIALFVIASAIYNFILGKMSGNRNEQKTGTSKQDASPAKHTNNIE